MHDDQPDDEAPDRHAALTIIAEALGKSVTDFFIAAATFPRPEESSELLKFWCMISDPNARRELVAHAATLAARDVGRTRSLDS